MTHVSHCKWYLILFWKSMGRVGWVPCCVRDVSGSLVCCSCESSRRLIGAVTSVTPLFLFSLSLPQFIPRGALTQPSALRTRRMQVAGLWSSMWRLPVISKVRTVFLALALYGKHAPKFCVRSLTVGLMQSPLKSTERAPFHFSGFWIRLKNVLTGDGKLAPRGKYGLAQCITIKWSVCSSAAFFCFVL